MHWLSFIGGMFVGGFLGVLVMALCVAAGREERTAEMRIPPEEK